MIRKFVFSLVLHNLPYKIAAILLAILFWYVIQGEEVLEVNRRMTVNLVAPDGFMVKGEAQRVKDVTIRGPRVLLSTLSTRNIEAKIYIPKSIARQYKRIRVDKEYVEGWDPRLRMVVHDPYLTVYIDERGSRKVPVREVQKGAPQEGFLVEKVVIKPALVDVLGLKSEVHRVQEVLTDPIDISGISETKSYKANLEAPTGFDRSSVPAEAVEVTFHITEKKEPRRFSGVPVDVTGAVNYFSVRPTVVTLEVQATSGVLTFVRSADFRAFVDVRDFPPGRFELPVQVKIPPDTVFIRAIPDKVIVDITDRRRRFSPR
jgi:YbbR domain-containing protein